MKNYLACSGVAGFVATILCFIATSSIASAQAPGEILEKIRENFNQVSSLQAQVNTTTVSTSLFPVAGARTDTSIFKYWEKAGSYYYEFTDTTQGPQLVAKHAYNSDVGDQYFTSDQGGFLQISKKKNDGVNMNTSNALLSPYAFLCPNQGSKANFLIPTPRLSDILNPNNWKELQSRLQLQKFLRIV